VAPCSLENRGTLCHDPYMGSTSLWIWPLTSI
jgi:hypothetical protein